MSSNIFIIKSYFLKPWQLMTVSVWNLSIPLKVLNLFIGLIAGSKVILKTTRLNTNKNWICKNKYHKKPIKKADFNTNHKNDHESKYLGVLWRCLATSIKSDNANKLLMFNCMQK